MLKGSEIESKKLTECEPSESVAVLSEELAVCGMCKAVMGNRCLLCRLDATRGRCLSRRDLHKTDKVRAKQSGPASNRLDYRGMTSQHCVSAGTTVWVSVPYAERPTPRACQSRPKSQGC
ncbi:unnamed protein product [Leuciscus chuanchicus]